VVSHSSLRVEKEEKKKGGKKWDPERSRGLVKPRKGEPHQEKSCLDESLPHRCSLLRGSQLHVSFIM
jgi:hypothetical protein